MKGDMKPTKNPGKYSSYVATEATQNSTIAAAQALSSVSGKFGSSVGAIVANPVGAGPGEDAPIAAMIADGVDPKAPFYLQVTIDGGQQNLGLIVNEFRTAMANNPPNPLEAMTRIHPGKSTKEVVAELAVANPEVLALLNNILGEAMNEVIKAEG